MQMKHMRTEQIPSTTREVVDHVTCDMCGSEIKKDGNYEVDEVEISHRVGYNYPECGYGETTIVDLCGNCFDGKLVPWLSSQGAEARTKDWDY